MKFVREEVQEKVDEYRELIVKHLNIPLEEIRVEEKRFGWLEKKTVMFTQKGKITIDPTKEYDKYHVNLEHTVLHELGHRITENLCPYWYETMLGITDEIKSLRVWGGVAKITKLVTSGRWKVISPFEEGAAECFAMDVVPAYLVHHNELKEFIKRRRVLHTINISYLRNPAGFGRPFFLLLYLSHGLKGLCSFIQNITTDEIPSMGDLENPTLYWGRYNKALPQSNPELLTQTNYH